MSFWGLLIVPVVVVGYYYYTKPRTIDLDNLLSQDQKDNIQLVVKQHVADTVRKNLEDVQSYLEEVKSPANLIKYVKEPKEPHLKLSVGTAASSGFRLETRVRYITKTTLKKHSNWYILMMIQGCDSVNLDSFDNNTVILPSEVIECEELDRQLMFLALSDYWKLPINTLDKLSLKGIVSSAAYSSFSPMLAPGIIPEQIVANCKITEFELSSKSYINLNNKEYKNAWYYLQYNKDILSYQVIKFDAYTTVIFLNGVPVLMSDYKTIFEDSSCDFIEAKLNSNRDAVVDSFTVDVNSMLPSSSVSLDLLLKDEEKCKHYCKIKERKTCGAYYPYKLTERPELFQLVEYLDLVVPGLQGPPSKQGPPGVRLYTIPKKLVCNTFGNFEGLDKKMLYKFQKGLQHNTPSIIIELKSNRMFIKERVEIYQGYLKLSSFTLNN